MSGTATEAPVHETCTPDSVPEWRPAAPDTAAKWRPAVQAALERAGAIVVDEPLSGPLRGVAVPRDLLDQVAQIDCAELRGRRVCIELTENCDMVAIYVRTED